MSPSTRSKSASKSSPATGDATKDGKDGDDAPFRAEDPDRAPQETVEVELSPSRDRQWGWAIGGTVGGVVLVLTLGTVGVWAGYVLIALGLFRAYQLVQSYLQPAGTFHVSAKHVRLPRGPHRGAPVEVAPADVTAVYFLRRSVPWNRAAPVLVVELGDRALAYPRDWFGSEADQRHIVHALLSHCPIPRASPPTAAARS